jgi:hypothetical protein
LLCSTVFTLFVVPAIFTLVLDVQQWLGAGSAVGAKHVAVELDDPGTEAMPSGADPVQS